MSTGARNDPSVTADRTTQLAVKDQSGHVLDRAVDTVLFVMRPIQVADGDGGGDFDVPPPSPDLTHLAESS